MFIESDRYNWNLEKWKAKYFKAIDSTGGQYFPKCSHGFRYGRDIEIQSFSINGQQYPYIQRNTSIEFQIDLYNNESLKIHMLYKSSKNPSFLTQSELEERQIYKKRILWFR